MTTARPAVPTALTSQRVLCPYCGEVSADPRRCEVCRGHFDPLSRQATQNAMGPWFIRDIANPCRPGCSIETLRDLIRRGKVTRDSIIRGPGTKQFWNFAGRTPSIANLLGQCHNCRATVKPDDYSCKACGASFSPDPDRQHMGLAPVHMLPGDASPEIIAAASLDTPGPAPVSTTAPAVSNASASKPRPKPTPARPIATNTETRSYGPWLVGITVAIVIAMGVAFALVATNTITLPWLQTSPSPEVPPTLPKVTPPVSNEPQPPPPQPAPSEAPVAPAGEPGPTRGPAAASPAERIDLEAVLRPMLTAEPFNSAAVLSRIEELRKAHPELSKDLDSWAAAAKARAERLRLRGVP